MADTLSPTVHSEASKVDSSSLLKTVNRIFTKLIDITKASESKYATRIILVLVALQVVDLFLFYSVDLFSKTKYTPINLPSGSTSGNNTSLTSYESEETRADDFTAFGSVHVLLFLALCLLQKTRYGVFVLPKTYAQIMRLFTEGFSKGAIMVSYCWGDKTYIKIPRRVASYFACTWIDIQNLIPGVAVAETCRQTAANAYFRIAFVSSKYLKSANCKVEFEEISKQPGKSILIAYPDITDDQISEYKKQGHFIYRIEETDNMSPMWVLQTMLQLGIFQYLWRIHSPAINGSWRFTVIFYSGKYNKYFLFPFITLIVAIALEVGFIVFTITITITRRALITRATIAVIVITLFLTVALLIIYVFCLLGRLIYGAVSQNLEDAGMLLIILQKILQIKPIKFYTNAKAIKKHLEPIINANALQIVETEAESDFSSINLDEVDEKYIASHQTPESLQNTILYTKNGFNSLSDALKKLVGNNIVGDSVPTNENLYCQLLMKFLHCGVNGLYSGKKHFRTLQLA